jgi:hypothetical protein
VIGAIGALASTVTWPLVPAPELLELPLELLELPLELLLELPLELLLELLLVPPELLLELLLVPPELLLEPPPELPPLPAPTIDATAEARPIVALDPPDSVTVRDLVPENSVALLMGIQRNLDAVLPLLQLSTPLVAV